MRIQELRQKSKQELQIILKDDQKKLNEFRFNLLAGKVKNVRMIRKIRKEIAQILTLLNTTKQ